MGLYKRVKGEKEHEKEEQNEESFLTFSFTHMRTNFWTI